MDEFGLGGESAVFVSRSGSVEQFGFKNVGSIVRVGAKEADVNEVMGRLRELR